MRPSTLAQKLITANTNGEWRRLLTSNEEIADKVLAEEIRKICHSSWTSQPIVAQRAASIMEVMAKFSIEPEVKAIGSWIRGIANITRGRFEDAVASLDHARKTLEEIGRDHDAAQTRVATVLALGMLGRYDDAVNSGEKARSIFLRHGDDIAAGKVEVNLSNIAARNGRHRVSEKYCLAALKRFRKLGEIELQAVAENGLANTYSELNEFEKADKYYRLALRTAGEAGMRVTEAEIEASIGLLAQIRGRYADALRSLEHSRTKYEALEMPHQSAIADVEIANIYFELNLNREAIEIYRQVSKDFRRLKMRAEEARTRLNYGLCSLSLTNLKTARSQLEQARKLFAAERNVPGQAAAGLALARLELELDNFKGALEILRGSRAFVRKSENPRDTPAADLIEAEAARRAGKHRKAAEKLAMAAVAAHELGVPDLEQAAVCAQGRMAEAKGDLRSAERLFKKAIRLVEGLRGPIASEEFSMGFLASRLEPFDRLTSLYLHLGRVSDAFRMIESGRSRSLLDSIQRGYVKDVSSEELGQIRAELNFHYRRLDRAAGNDTEDVRKDIGKAEKKLQSLTRRLNSLSAATDGRNGRVREKDVLTTLYERLGDTAALVEFVEYEGRFAAFVVSRGRTRFVPHLASAREISQLLDDLHFQFGTFRYGASGLKKFHELIRSRTDLCLERLYDLLINPIEKYLSGEQLVFVPSGNLNYVPFHALRSNGEYLVERSEISYAPSATVWCGLQGRKRRPIKSPLIVGFADERIPLVEKEVGLLDQILPNAKCLAGKNASFSAFSQLAPQHDLIHLACHGQFRPESPMFSSLHLADGWITVHDICSKPIKAELVTLSACETGLSKVFAGDEILGLARGFLSAGANSIVVGLWAVNDAAATEFMTGFYTGLQRGMPIVSSLRESQLEMIENGAHPHLWSPFILIG